MNNGLKWTLIFVGTICVLFTVFAMLGWWTIPLLVLGGTGWGIYTLGNMTPEQRRKLWDDAR